MQEKTRPVIIKAWIPVVYFNPHTKEESPVYSGSNLRKPSTGCFSDHYVTRGTFHLWGSRIHETDESMYSETVGIIELNDGSIELVYPQNIKFLDIQ